MKSYSVMWGLSFINHENRDPVIKQPGCLMDFVPEGFFLVAQYGILFDGYINPLRTWVDVFIPKKYGNHGSLDSTQDLNPRLGITFSLTVHHRGHKLAEWPGDRICPKSTRIVVAEKSSRKNNSRLIMLESWTHKKKEVKGSLTLKNFWEIQKKIQNDPKLATGLKISHSTSSTKKSTVWNFPSVHASVDPS